VQRPAAVEVAPAIAVQRPAGVKVAPTVRVQGTGATKGGPTLKVKRPEVEVEAEEEEETYDEETMQEWFDETRAIALEHLTPGGSLYIAPNIPRDKIRTALQTHEEEFYENDNIVVLYDPPGGGSDDGFVATPWGLFWKNRGEDPQVVWWEDLDLDDVELDDETLTIEGTAVRINRQDQGLADALGSFIEAMVDWAQSED
jgi:hypothetical protein